MVFEQLLPIGAAIVAAIGWSTIGLWEQWRKGSGLNVDRLKLGKNILVGVGLGIGTYVTATVNGQPEPIISNVNQFWIAVGGYFPLVVIVQKLITKKATE